MSDVHKHAHWTTENEIAYINSLHSGTYPREFGQHMDGQSLLENYIRSAKKRILWNTFGSVDGAKVLAHAIGLLGE